MEFLVNLLKSAVAALALAAAACSGHAADQSKTATTADRAAAPTPAVAHASPAAMPPAQGAETVTGEVVETMDASTYTYVRVKTSSGDIWAATSQFPVKVGDRVTVPLESPMQNFHSQSLNRDFPLIYFASSIAKEGQPPAPGANPHGAMSGGAAQAATVTEPIKAPAGGMTIAQVW